MGGSKEASKSRAETSMYRSVDDVGGTTRPALRRYEWVLIDKAITLPEYRKKNVQAWGYMLQAELLESLRNSREQVGGEIRERLWNCREERTKGIRSEYNPTVSQIWEKDIDPMWHVKSLINQSIDTDEEWGRAGMIPEGLLNIRRIQAQDEIGKSIREPPEYEKAEGRLFPPAMGICGFLLQEPTTRIKKG